MSTPLRPPPQPGFHDGPYWAHVAAGRLCLQRCADCGHLRYPPGPVCPECLAAEHAWEPLSGAGRLLAWTVFRRQYFPEIPVPYVVAAVRTPEGPILIGNLVTPDGNAAAATGLSHDMPVRAVYQRVAHPEGEWWICQWTPSHSLTEPEETA